MVRCCFGLLVLLGADRDFRGELIGCDVATAIENLAGYSGRQKWRHRVIPNQEIASSTRLKTRQSGKASESR